MDEPTQASSNRSSPTHTRIVGGVIGGCFVLCLIIFLVQFFWLRRMKRHQRPQNVQVKQSGFIVTKNDHSEHDSKTGYLPKLTEERLQYSGYIPGPSRIRLKRPLPLHSFSPPPPRSPNSTHNHHETSHINVFEAQYGKSAVHSNEHDDENPFV